MSKWMPIKLISRKVLIITLTIIVGFGVFTANLSQGVETKMQFAAVKKGNIKSTISASGTLTGKDTVNLKFRSGGKLAWINVKSGDRVTAWQGIAGLDTTDLGIALQQAENNYLSAQASAQKTEDDVKNHDSDETFTQKETRVKSQVARDNAYDNLRAARRDFEDTIIVSPIAGIITQLNVLAGQFVGAGDIIAQVVDDSKIYFNAEIDEADSSKISVGQTAEISFNAYPDQVFTGKVEQILPQAETTSNNATVIPVRILVNNPPRFIAGLNGQVSIITLESANTLSIPLEALGQDNEVAVFSPQGIEFVKVVPGISSDTDTEIKEGLNEGQRVVLNPPGKFNIRRANNPLNQVFRFFRAGR